MNDLYREYDEVMIGKRDGFSSKYFGKDNTKNTENAIKLFNYSFRKYLRWPPEAIEKKIDKELLVKLRLYPLLKYIPFPIEYDKEKDLYYLVTLVYNNHNLSLRDKTIHTYEMILDGSITKYPKDYFIGNDGLVKAGICFQYLINNNIIFESINELYSIFSCETGYEYLKKYKLLNACRDAFDTPVDFLHFALPADDKDEFLYRFYKFKYQKEMVNEKGRKRRTLANYKLEEVYS